MKRVKCVLLVFLILISTFALFQLPSVKADNGSARVYVLCLAGISGECGGAYDPAQSRDGAIEAVMFSEDKNLPRVHPIHSKTAPFFSIDYLIVTDWDTYKRIVETNKNIIVVNTHGEIIPIPSPYQRGTWVDEIAEAMLTRRLTWVHTGGYPLYYAWYQGSPSMENDPAWGVTGFKKLMYWINKSDVECGAVRSEMDHDPLTPSAESVFMVPWDFSQVRSAQHFRPLKISDFGDYVSMPIWGCSGETMVGAAIAFARPSQRYDPRYHNCFGSYVHIGTKEVYDFDESPVSPSEYWRTYAGVAVAIWLEVQAFNRVGASKVYDETYYHTLHTEWGVTVAPLVSSYSFNGVVNEFYITFCFGILGSMKTNRSDVIDKCFFTLNCPPDCDVMLRSDVSRMGRNLEEPNLSGFGDLLSGGILIADTAVYILALGAMGMTMTALTGIGGVLLFSNWFVFTEFRTPYSYERGLMNSIPQLILNMIQLRTTLPVVDTPMESTNPFYLLS